MSYKSISKTIDRTLEIFGVNTVLDKIEDSKQAGTVRRMIRESLKEQMLSLATKENVERALQIASKARVNQQIVDFLTRQAEPMDEETMRALKALLVVAAVAGGQAALNRMDKNEEFVLENEGSIDNRVGLLATSLVMTSIRFITTKIEETREEILTLNEAVDFIHDEIPGISRERAKMIVDNEIAVAVNESEFQVFRESGVRMLRWITVMDERVCPICQPMDGQTRAAGTDFLGGDFSAALHPPIHIRCRCFLEPANE